MKLLRTWGSLAIFTAQALAQGVLPPASGGSPADVVESPPAPLAPDAPTEADLSSASQLSDSGRSALANGIVSEAVNCFKKALAIPNLDSSTKDSLNLDLATAYLSDDQLDSAAAALQAVAATDTAAYLLRSTLLKSRQGQWDGAEGAAAQLARIDPGKLSAADLPWYYTAQARLAEHQGNADAANKAWNNAIAAAPPLLQGQFIAALADSQVLLSKTFTADEVEKLRIEMNAATRPADGANFASLYSIGLDQLGQHDQALKNLKDWVGRTDLDPKNRDKLRLLWVYLDNKGPAPADPALNPDSQVLLEDILQEPIDVNSPDRDAISQLQKQALSMLEKQVFGEKPESGSVITNPTDLEKFIDGILTDTDADSHPLLKQLYLFKARLALLLNETDAAAKAANDLVNKYLPGSDHDPAVTDAHMVLAEVYWHNGQPDGQPRQAINQLLIVYNSLPPDQQPPIARSLACLYYMSGDYHNAAAFYANLLKSPGLDSPLSRGDLLLRAIESDLRAGQIDEAEKIMEDSASLVGVDSDDRWRAEWNVLIAMSKSNPDTAFQQLNHLLDPNHGADLLHLLQPDLYLRLRWLHAYLAVGRSEPEAEKIVEVLQKEVESFTPEIIAGLSPEERQTLVGLLPQLRAEALLLQGQAEGQAQQFDQEGKTFAQLRQSYSGTDPALRSYFIEASELDAQHKPVDAQRLMNTVTDTFPKDPAYAPTALYMSALYSYDSGKTAEALNLLQKFVDKYQNNPAQTSLLYSVRLKQAYLEGKLDTQASWENARDIYEALIKDPNNPFPVDAKVGHANALFQLAGMPEANPQRREDAMDELNVLYNQPNLPVDARMEVGYMYGKLLESDGKPDPDATHQYWLVVDNILLKDQPAAELDNTPNGRYWMMLCLSSLKQIYLSENKEREAQGVDGIISRLGLGPGAPPAGTAPAPVPAPANQTAI